MTPTSIIFDLGGVIINLEMERSYAEIMKLAGLTGNPLAYVMENIDFFQRYECGGIGDEEFRNGLRGIFGIEAEDKVLDHAWNAMLRDIPAERVRLMEELSDRYQLFVLSNTNAIHIDAFTGILEHEHQRRELPGLKKAYYSHLTGYRKPEKEIFQLVLDENNLDPAQTIFIDDTLENIEAAQTLGLITRHMRRNGKLREYFLDEIK